MHPFGYFFFTLLHVLPGPRCYARRYGDLPGFLALSGIYFYFLLDVALFSLCLWHPLLKRSFKLNVIGTTALFLYVFLVCVHHLKNPSPEFRRRCCCPSCPRKWTLTVVSTFSDAFRLGLCVVCGLLVFSMPSAVPLLLYRTGPSLTHGLGLIVLNSTGSICHCCSNI